MKIRFMSFLILSVCFSSNYAMQTEIIMPPANVLKQRLICGGFNFLMGKTQIVENLANQSTQPLGVAAEVERAIADYLQYFKQNSNVQTFLDMKISMMEKKLPILEILLQDYPDSFHELSYLLIKHE